MKRNFLIVYAYLLWANMCSLDNGAGRKGRALSLSVYLSQYHPCLFILIPESGLYLLNKQGWKGLSRRIRLEKKKSSS